MGPARRVRFASLLTPLALAWLASGCTTGEPAPDAADLTKSPAATEPPAAWLDGVRAAIGRTEYQLTQSAPGAVRFSNRAQGLTANLGGGVVTIGPRLAAGLSDAAADGWSLSLRASGIGRGASRTALAAADAAPGACDLDGRTDAKGACLRMAELARGDVKEWWRNTEAGLEQGFTVSTLPAGAGPLRVDVAIDGAQLTVSESVVTMVAGSARLTYGGLVASDATGRKLAARFVPIDGGVSIEVEDAGAVAPITIDPLIQTEAWHVEGSQVVAKLGTTVASAGDVNGDGFADVAVGAPFYDDGETDEGVVFVYYGSKTGLRTTASWTAGGDQVSALFGKAIAAGDFNGDGYSDLLVGAPDYTHALSGDGAVFLFKGGLVGLGGRSTTVYGSRVGEHFGAVVASAGDVDGDYDADVLVGAPASGEFASNAGKAYLFRGVPSGFSTTAAWTRLGTEIGASMGGAMSGAGDVNGDGYGDVIVSASFTDVGAVNDGKVELFLGDAAGLTTTPSWTSALGQANSLYGFTVAGLGDVNGDGYSDVAIGSSYYDETVTDEGAVFVYLGQSGAVGLETTASWHIAGGQQFGQLGQAVSAAGDVNGDGYADLMVGEGLYSVDASNLSSGRAAVFLGSRNGMVNKTAFAVDWPEGNTQYGSSVAGVGDVNGDGFGDVVVGAPSYSRGDIAEGASFLYYGAASGLAADPFLAVSGDADLLELSLATAGDVNADGFDDLLVGAPTFSNGQANEGAAWIFLGADDGPSNTASWGLEGGAVDAALGTSVARAGDVNGDGYDDVVIGAPSRLAVAGAAYVYLGGSGSSYTLDATLVGGAPSARFGASVSGAGDVDNDGFDDVIIGEPTFGVGGRARVYRGGQSGLSTTATTTFTSTDASAQCGASVSGAGDVNGDRFADVVVGCPVDTATAPSAVPRVLAFLGSVSGTQAAPAWSAPGNPGDRFGASVAGVGDVDGDGFSDVAVGAPSTGLSRPGYVRVYGGGVDGLSVDSVGYLGGMDLADELGASVAAAGDVNGDGFGDYVVGAPGLLSGSGSVLLSLGSPSGGGSTPVAQGGAGDRLGSAVAGGDFNGDGYSDVAVGAGGTGGFAIFAGNGEQTNASGFPVPVLTMEPGGARVPAGDLLGGRDVDVDVTTRSPAGLARVGFDAETAFDGAAFDGAGLVSSARPFASSGLGGSSVTVPVHNLAADSAVRWRVRTRADATTPYPGLSGRWIYGGTAGARTLAAFYSACADIDADGNCGRLDADEDNDGVVDARDPSRNDPRACGDSDADGCDDCSVGTDGFGPLSDVLTGNDGADMDSDALCDVGDLDVDGDGVDNVADSAPLDRFVCADADRDSCEDCSGGSSDTAHDGPDLDADGLCDATDPDRDGDGVANNLDLAPNDPASCVDADADGCDDCVNGSPDPSNDGLDTNRDGECNVGDPDDDGDGYPDTMDLLPLIAGLCGDSDQDLCDDCSNGGFSLTNDGPDFDFDGLCDVGDPDIDGDDVDNDADSDPLDERRCSDDDGDTCDDCTNKSYDLFNDGDDNDGDGICNQGDLDADNDGVNDIDDDYPADPNRCHQGADDRCDDCTSGHSDPFDDGPDCNNDGACDDTETDDDHDGVIDSRDRESCNIYVCSDSDFDGCDDCTNGGFDMANDGADYDGDGQCDLTDPPPVTDTDSDTDDSGGTVVDTDNDTDGDTDTVVLDTDDTDGDTDLLPTDTDDTDVAQDTDGNTDTTDTDDGSKKNCGCATGADPSALTVLAALWLLRRRRRA